MNRLIYPGGPYAGLFAWKKLRQRWRNLVWKIRRRWYPPRCNCGALGEFKLNGQWRCYPCGYGDAGWEEH